jgi:hypothetical protein
MTASLESAQRSKIDPVLFDSKLTVTDRQLLWLQKQHPSAHGHKLQLWASGAFNRPRASSKVSVVA